MLAKIQSRGDVALYIIGFLLVISVFSGCTQKAPPLSVKAVAPEAQVKADKPADPAPAPKDPAVVPAQNEVKEGELSYTIFPDASETLYRSMKAKKITDEKTGVITKTGKNYSCSDNKKAITCAFTIITKDLSIKESNVLVAGESEGELRDVGTTGDLFVFTVDESPASRGTSFYLTPDSAKQLYGQVKEFESDKNENKKRGKQILCFHSPATDTLKEAYSCQIFITWSSGEIQKVEAPAAEPAAAETK